MSLNYIYVCFDRAQSYEENYKQALGDKAIMREQKIQAERERRQAVLRATRLAAKQESVQQLRKAANSTAVERDRLHKQNRELQESNMKLLMLGEQLREMQDAFTEVHGQVKELARERELLRKQNEELLKDGQALQRQLEQVSTGGNVLEVSRILGVSPKSLKQVERYSTKWKGLRGKCHDATMPDEGQRNYFLERIVRELTPAVERICSIPKFGCDTPTTPGVSDVAGVVKLVARRIEHSKGQTRRKLFQVKRKRNGSPNLSQDLNSVLKEMSTAWRSARRNQDRDAAARLLQMTLLAIPKRRGKGELICMYRCDVLTLHILAG